MNDTSVYTWSNKMDLPFFRARTLGFTAEAYGVSEAAFKRGLEHVYLNDKNKLNTIPETFYYYPRAYPNSKYGYNFPAAMREFSLVGYSTDDSFIWTLLAFRYNTSLEDIKEVLVNHSFEDICQLYASGYSNEVVVNMMLNNIDMSIIDAALSA